MLQSAQLLALGSMHSQGQQRKLPGLGKSFPESLMLGPAGEDNTKVGQGLINGHTRLQPQGQ